MKIITALKQKMHFNLPTEDKRQSKAFVNILKFFAIMLVLTFIARGTAAAALSKVTLGTATAGTVTNKLEIDGKIDFASSKKITAPPGLQIEKLLLEEGEIVEASQKLVLFDKKSTDTAIKVKKAEIDKMYVEYNLLKNNAAPDDFELRSAQNKFDVAVKEWDELQIRNELNIEIAKRKYDTALQNYNRAKDEADEEQQILAAKEALNLESDNLRLTKLLADQSMYNAARLVSNAQEELNNARKSVDTKKEQHNQDVKSKYADAALLLLDIESEKEVLKSMQEIQKNDCFLQAPQSGRLSSWNAVEGEASVEQIAMLTDESEGYTFTFALTKKQAEQISSGTKISITQKNNSIDTVVSYVKPQNEEDTFIAVAKINDGKFNVGTAKSSITLSQNDYPICISSTAVHKDNQGSFVYIIEEKNTILGLQNIVSRMSVTILEQANNLTAVSETLLADSKIIMSATKAVKAGDRVRIIK